MEGQPEEKDKKKHSEITYDLLLSFVLLLWQVNDLDFLRKTDINPTKV
jgi:hypothetical protein